VSDLPTILGTEVHEGGKESRGVQFWTSRIGSVYDDRERLIATSPAQHAGNVKAPILLMHGEGDTTVYVNQSEIMEKALLKAGKTVEFIRFTGGEDHYLNFPATRIRVLKETERFLDKYIGH
jgi:dipeptidyl aminopeptidase/acylaminoacyl peptidase